MFAGVVVTLRMYWAKIKHFLGMGSADLDDYDDYDDYDDEDGDDPDNPGDDNAFRREDSRPDDV